MCYAPLFLWASCTAIICYSAWEHGSIWAGEWVRDCECLLAGQYIKLTRVLSLSLSLFPSKTRPPDEPFSMLDFFWLNSSGSETLSVLRYYRKSMFNTWLKGNSRWVNTCAGYVPTGNAPPCKQKVFIYPEITILPEEITVLYGHEPLCHGFMPPFLSMAAPDEPWMDTRSTNEETAEESTEWGLRREEGKRGRQHKRDFGDKKGGIKDPSAIAMATTALY